MVDINKVASNTAGKVGAGLAKKAQSQATSGLTKALGGTVGAQAALVVNAYASAALNNEYPNVGFRFALEIDGIIAAQFSEASGAEWEMEQDSFHEGGVNSHERRMVGRAKFTPLSLKRGHTPAGSEFYLWLKQSFEYKKSLRRNLSLVVMNQEGIEVGRLNFKKAFITKYSGPSFNAESNTIAFEQVVLHYDYFEYQPRDINEVMTESTSGWLADIALGAITGR